MEESHFDNCNPHSVYGFDPIWPQRGMVFHKYHLCLHPLQPQNRFGWTPTQYSTYTVADCRGLVKTLVCGVKTITWGIVSCKAVGTGWLELILFKQSL